MARNPAPAPAPDPGQEPGQEPGPDMDPDMDPDEVTDARARDAVTVGELARQTGPSAFVPVPLEEVETQ